MASAAAASRLRPPLGNATSPVDPDLGASALDILLRRVERSRVFVAGAAALVWLSGTVVGVSAPVQGAVVQGTVVASNPAGPTARASY